MKLVSPMRAPGSFLRLTGRALALVAMLAVLTAGSSEAQDVCFVDTGGSDAEDGQTPISAKRTIAACLAASFIGDGDIISIEAGTYGEGHLTVSEALIFEARQTGAFTRVLIENGLTVNSDVTFRANTTGGFSDGVFRLGATNPSQALILDDGSLTVSDSVPDGRLRIADGGRVTRDDDAAVSGTISYVGTGHVYYVDNDGSDSDVTASGELPPSLGAGELNVNLGGENMLTLPSSVTGIGLLNVAANSSISGTVVVAADMTINGPGNVGTLDIDAGIVTVSSSFECEGINIDDNPSISFDLGGQTITNRGDFVRLGGNFNSGDGMLMFVGGSSSTFAAGPNFQIGALGVEKNGATLTITQDLELTASGGVSAYEAAIGSTVSVVGGTTLTLAGDWDNRGVFLPGTGTVEFNGTGPQSFANTDVQSFHNLEIDKPSGDVLLDGDATIDGTLQLTSGDLDLNGHVVTLGADAVLSETDGNTVKGSAGHIETTRVLNAPSGVNLAGLGFEITSPANLGSTQIVRGHGEQSVNGKTSLFRYFDVNPTNNTGLDAELVYHYDESELNALNEGALALYRSTDGGTTWTSESGSVDATANEIQLSGVDAFSRWTAAAPIVVTNTNDSGPGSLRQAIIDANDRSGLDEIHFDIAGSGPHTIQPTTPLPAVDDPVSIDGYTQAGATVNTNPASAGINAILMVELDGSIAGGGAAGLTIFAGGSTVRGLVINRFGGPAINLDTGGGNVIVGNFLGTNVSGVVGLRNGSGVWINLSDDNVVGGTSNAARNLISDNVSGVNINQSSGTLIQGNLIGTDITGTVDLGNDFGIALEDGALSTEIGGSDGGARNVISGSAFSGINFVPGANDNKVQGNFIGTDVSGTTGLGNTEHGIFLNASNNIIGGTTPGERNIISDNRLSGIVIEMTGNTVLGNYIGTDLTGTVDLGNTFSGVVIANSSGHTIGGTAVGAGNVISGNGAHGVEIAGTSSSGNAVKGNLIGLDPTGSAALGNAGDGVRINAAVNNTIGGTTATARNYIAGNAFSGVAITGTSATGNKILHNYIGMGAGGTTAIGNKWGIQISASPDNVIGEPGSGNLISGNTDGGISISGSTATGNIIQGNLVGTDSAGMAAVGNGAEAAGIALVDAPGNQIGGAGAAEGNVISGNLRSGIAISGSEASGNEVLGNYIGTNIDGDAVIADLPPFDLDNGPFSHGINISDAPGTIIGGDSEGEGNLISGNPGAGVTIIGVDATVIEGNRIGTTVAGTSSVPNGRSGVNLAFASGTVVGGTTPGAGNVISGNLRSGVRIRFGSTGTQIQGNLIGTDNTGSAALPNLETGVEIGGGSTGNTIGGTDPNARNVISGNGSVGVQTEDAATTGNAIQGNYIGTDVSGTSALPNADDGIRLFAPNNTVGGTATGAGNVISGNGNIGVEINGADASGNVVEGNLIGTAADGLSDLGNTNHGILVIDASGNTIGGGIASARNVISANGAYGVSITGGGATGNDVQGNFIGTDLNGTADLGNDGGGVEIVNGASSNTVGGAIELEGNIISGNGDNPTPSFPSGVHGVVISDAGTTENVVIGNYIGTDISGNSALGNGGDGVQILNGASGNKIGGSDPGEGNVISGNDVTGIAILDSGTADNTLEGNYIGLNALGEAIIGHINGTGVYIGPGATGTSIGGTSEGSRNLISGNTGWAGIAIEGSSHNIIFGNYIGTDASGTVSLGNLVGIRIYGDATDNEIGGIDTGAGNLIVHNIEDGVSISDSGNNNSILSNSIYRNGELGIDLGDDGVTLNDDESDTGPNNLQNFPVLLVPEYGDGAVTVSGTLTSGASTTYTVEVFASESCDPSGHGEGQKFVASSAVITNAAGTGSFDVTVPTESVVGPIMSATATDPSGNTSEFSKCPLPEIQAPKGYMSEVFADGFAEPQGLALDGSGSLLVSAVGSGEIFRINMTGTRERIAFGFGRPVDVAVDGNVLYVSDLDLNGIYVIDLSSIPPEGIEIDPGAPFVSGLNGPTHLEISPDGSLYVSEVRGSGDDRVTLVDLATAATSPIITFSGNVNPQGKAFLSDAMFVAYQLTGEVREFTPNGTPVDGSTLPVVLQNLESPGGLDFGLGDRLYVAESRSVALAKLGETEWTPFLTGLSGGQFNNVFVTDSGVIYAADYAGGRIIRVAAPVRQTLASGHLAYHINADGNPTISDGSDFVAVQNAFQHWEDVTSSTITFSYEGTSPLEKAHAGDGVNLVTFKDTDFLFSSGVLAVAAKTIVFAEDGETGEIIDADMIFNPDFVTDSGLRVGTDTSPGEYDIEGIAAHEAGHMVGREHSGVPHATMFFVLPSGIKARSLELDDRAWVSHAYPEPTFTTTFGAIEGTVYDGENPGATVAGALVIALEDGSTTEAVHAYSDENGFYHIPGLPSGKSYKVLLRPLNGAVFGTNMQPGHVSQRMHDMTTKTDYPGEWYNGGDEAAEPGIDDPSQFTLVAVNSVASGIDFFTNIDETPPSVTGVSPKQGDAGVSTTTQIVVGFSEAVDPATFESSFLLSSSEGGVVTGNTIFIEDKTAVFTPDNELAHSTLYTIEILPGVKDFKGNASTETLSSTFTTRDPDTTPPAMTAIEPSDTATDVFITSDVTVAFSESIDPSTVTASSFQVLNGTTAVAGTISLEQNNTVAVFDPDPNLLEGVTYTVNLTADIEDPADNALPPASTSFETVAHADPLIEFIGPADGATDITVETPVLIDFSEPINRSSFESHFTLTDSDGAAIQVGYEYLNLDSRVVIRPASSLSFAETYSVVVAAGVLDVSASVGTLASSSITTFTTAASVQNPSITFVSPPSAAVGTTVSIGGEGFDPDPSKNTVSFNGTIATASASTLTSITTTVPLGATSGDLTVTVGSRTSDAFHFDVVEPIDLENAAIAETSTGGSTQDVDMSPDGTRAYVTNPSTNTVSIIDLVSASNIGSIAVGQKPLKIAVHPSGTRAYVTNFDDHTLSVIDLTTEPEQVVATIAVGLNPTGVAVTPDGSRVYVAGFTSRLITVIDADPTSGAYNNGIAQTSTGGSNTDLAFSPDGTLAFVTGSVGVTIISTDPTSETYNSAIAETSTGGSSESVEFSPDGTFAVVVTSDGAILILDANPNSSAPFQAIAETSTGGSTSDIEFSPDGTLIFATNFESGTVTVLEINFSAEPDPIAASKEGTKTEPVTGLNIVITPIATFDVGDGPEGIVLDPNRGTIVVANSLSNDVSIIKFSPTPEERIHLLIAGVNTLADAGALGQGERSSLIAQLESALGFIEKGKMTDAVKKLETFIHLVNGGVDKGRIDPDTGEALITEAELVIQQLDGSASKGGVSEASEEELPDAYRLAQNYPNPFSGTTAIEYDIPDAAIVRLEIYDVLGRRVTTLINGEQEPGRYAVTWDGTGADGIRAASGLYLCRIQAGEFEQVRKIMIAR